MRCSLIVLLSLWHESMTAAIQRIHRRDFFQNQLAFNVWQFLKIQDQIGFSGFTFGTEWRFQAGLVLNVSVCETSCRTDASCFYAGYWYYIVI